MRRLPCTLFAIGSALVLAAAAQAEPAVRIARPPQPGQPLVVQIDVGSPNPVDTQVQVQLTVWSDANGDCILEDPAEARREVLKIDVEGGQRIISRSLAALPTSPPPDEIGLMVSVAGQSAGAKARVSRGDGSRCSPAADRGVLSGIGSWLSTPATLAGRIGRLGDTFRDVLPLGCLSLVAIDADTAAARPLLADPAANFVSPDFSPDGTRLAVVVDGVHGTRLEVVDVSSLARHVLLTAPGRSGASGGISTAVWADDDTVAVTLRGQLFLVSVRDGVARLGLPDVISLVARLPGQGSRLIVERPDPDAPGGRVWSLVEAGSPALSVRRLAPTGPWAVARFVQPGTNGGAIEWAGDRVVLHRTGRDEPLDLGAVVRGCGVGTAWAPDGRVVVLSRGVR